ncbi:Asp-tRNA(Asn)/Glu-tRNA(Gln) amidotransferase subunit GatA, partial [Candidatus Azambacteria bacterium]|nr:Asp-tRNA(Asn)/Glu-tRNA(Gln) amidotransferase subunit GatA [Candidatus Azambacteria bacterium]
QGWKTDSLEGMKIGLPREYFVKGMNQEVKDVMDRALERLKNLGIEILEVSLPHTPYALATYYIVMPAEVSANLARYDGIRYGYSAARESRAGKLADVYGMSRADGFGDEVRRRIMLGTYTLSAGYYEAYYLKAQKVRRLIQEDFLLALEKVDVILAPTSPTPAFRLGEKTTDPLQMYLEDIYTVSANLAGVPALAVPAGVVGKLPVGVQFIGKHFDEAKLFRAAYVFEQTRELAN